jgi:hypothetical protein
MDPNRLAKSIIDPPYLPVTLPLSWIAPRFRKLEVTRSSPVMR